MPDSRATPLPPPADRRLVGAFAGLTATQGAGASGTEAIARDDAGSGAGTGDGAGSGAGSGDGAGSGAEAGCGCGCGTGTGTGGSSGNAVGRRAGARLTPAQAFDVLHAYCAPALQRQAYLLTGRHDHARDAVARAFRLAWQRWPEVARDPDPPGWVRAAAYDCALSPWRSARRAGRRPDVPPDPADQALQAALLRLPPCYRRTLVLHDGVGLNLPDTAAETEAGTAATANRLLHAREAVATLLPDLADPAELHRRLVRLASAEHSPVPAARDLRAAGERGVRLWTRSALVLTAAVAGATALTWHTAPAHYVAPVSPGHAVEGLPVPGALGPVSRDALRPSTKLHKGPFGGPERLLPLAR